MCEPVLEISKTGFYFYIKIKYLNFFNVLILLDNYL
jgi:hypothetical protein